LARDSLRAAQKFAKAVIVAGRSPGDLPERGRVVPELNDPSVRGLFVSRYRLVCEIFEDRVAIERITHGSRDFLAVWKERHAKDSPESA
jgi:plasmid stabilization system protein ParE